MRKRVGRRERDWEGGKRLERGDTGHNEGKMIV